MKPHLLYGTTQCKGALPQPPPERPDRPIYRFIYRVGMEG